MVVHVFKTPEELAQAAAMVFAAQIAKKPDTVLGLATGSTPVGTYRELARLNRLGLIDFSEVRTYNLDEYIGLEPTAGFCANLGILNKMGCIETDSRMRTSCPGIFGAGDIIAKQLRQVATACGDGAVAAHNAASYVESLRK